MLSECVQGMIGLWCNINTENRVRVESKSRSINRNTAMIKHLTVIDLCVVTLDGNEWKSFLNPGGKDAGISTSMAECFSHIRVVKEVEGGRCACGGNSLSQSQKYITKLQIKLIVY